MSWLQISINTTKNNAQLAEDCLFEIGAQTITLTDAEDQPILEPAPNETPVWNQVVITGLFDAQQDQAQLLSYISSTLTDIDFSYDTEILQDKNWTREWMEHFQAMQFGNRLWVCPLHQEPPDKNAINLRLDPGLAFGTGTHPTTALCLRWLDNNIYEDAPQTSLLDYGCGSGILAIAACLLGLTQVDGVDIDPQALTATADNATVNNVTERIHPYLPEDYNKEHANTQYDIVVANILSGPLAELSPILAGHCKSGGDIVLSGILKEQAETVSQAYEEYFKMDAPVIEQDWVLLHGVRK